MKHALLITVISSSFFFSATATDCMISMEPQWHNICTDPDHIVRFGGKWIVVGSITFRKKSKDPAKLGLLKLAWHGENIDHLHGSLYKKIPDKEFLAIEQNLVCDSNWNKARQEMVLDFRDNLQTLGPLNIFYLVLTVPPAMENRIKSGSFSLLNRALPESLQTNREPLKLDIAQYMQHNTLTPVSS